MMPRLHEFLSHWGLTVHGLVTLAGLVVYVIASHTRRQRRHPSAAIAWVVSLALMPYLALPLYLLFGSRKVTRGPLLRDTPALPGNMLALNAPAYRFQQLAAAMGLPPAAAYEQLAIHQNGKEALAALRSVLLEARQTLDICTFLIGRDALGQEVSELLMRQARRGVRHGGSKRNSLGHQGPRGSPAGVGAHPRSHGGKLAPSSGHGQAAGKQHWRAVVVK